MTSHLSVELIPSSARATAPSASPLPEQLTPLLQDTLERIKSIIDKVLPVSKPRNALEEAEWEDEGDEGALAREMLLQSMETMRIYRPRVVLHGELGMGQNYVAAAALHHLDGFNVQSLDMGNLMGDSARVSISQQKVILNAQCCFSRLPRLQSFSSSSKPNAISHQSSIFPPCQPGVPPLLKQQEQLYAPC